MRRIAGMVVLAACLAVPARAQEPKADAASLTAADVVEEVMTMRVEGDIVVDADGTVRSHSIATQINDKLRALVDAAVAGWRFDPPRIDGQAATVRGAMIVTLAARENDGGFNVRVDNVRFEQARRDGEAPPKHRKVPIRLVKMRPLPRHPGYTVDGLVTIVILFNPDGTVAQAMPSQCSLYGAAGPPVVKFNVCRMMGDNSVAAVRKWKARFDTGGKPLLPGDLSGTLPMMYLAGFDDSAMKQIETAGVWRHESRTRYRTAPWLERERLAQRVGTADVLGNAMQPSTSPLRLREETMNQAL